MSDEEARHWDRIAVWLTGIAVFMFIIPAIIVARNGANIIEATALMATGAGTLVTTIMSKMTIFPRGSTALNTLPRRAERSQPLRSPRFSALLTLFCFIPVILSMSAPAAQGKCHNHK